MIKAECMARLKRSRIVPVIRASSPDEALRMIEALLAGGIDILEITMTVPNAVELIREVAEGFGSRALVGAGTVLDPETAEACIAAGAQFVVSPAFDTETVMICNKHGIVIAPGALTPSEIVCAFHAGGDIIKVFPCDALGGASYLRSLRAPLPHIPLMPTGGVTLETLPGFLAAGAVAVGVGTSLADPKISLTELTDRARAFRAAVP